MTDKYEQMARDVIEGTFNPDGSLFDAIATALRTVGEAEYRRGLEDAAGVCDAEESRLDGESTVLTFAEQHQCKVVAAAIRALKENGE